jgi:oxalate decarboxylase/phosphoglucose isomerase-like protein (cupin superfamily)
VASNPHSVPNSVSKTVEIINHNVEYILKARPALVPEPPIAENFPYEPLLNIVDRWNPDNPDQPSDFVERLQHFDYGNLEERAMAEKYRNAELPFKLFNVSEFNDVSILWTDGYLHEQLVTNFRASYRTEKSKDNHFMYWSGRGRTGGGYKPPTEVINMGFDKWLKLANKANEQKIDNNTEHFYFMTNAPAHDHQRTFVSRDLPLFSTEKKNFFITKPEANKGIQCRFGMRGVIAESHYDSGRNMVAMLKGNKRYILNPPWACKQIGIISDRRHPSYRHSVIDWSDPTQARSRGFSKVDAIDTVLHTGQVLYIPTYWFHYMVSLDYSIQCNSRSGPPPNKEGAEHVQLCLKQ